MCCVRDADERWLSKSVSDLPERFLELLGEDSVLLGIGNSSKGDDGVGPWLLGKLQGRVNGTLLDCGVAPENFLGRIINLRPRKIILLDAANLDEPPGTMRLIGPDHLEEGQVSTHGASLKLAIDYLQAAIPGLIVWLLLIQVKRCVLGEDISDEVRHSIDGFVSML
jgi:hydrogenase 3 maturation protease